MLKYTLIAVGNEVSKKIIGLESLFSLKTAWTLVF